MKKLYALKAVVLVLFVSLFASCSDDDSSSTDNNNNPTPIEQHFDYSYDGQVVPVTILQAVRVEDHFAVSATTADGLKNVEIEFNKHGNLVEALAINGFDWQAAYYYNKSNYFTFTLIEIDEENKTIEGTFSGKVFDDEYDITSDFNTVSGSFKVVYTEEQPQVAGLHFDAAINGTNWYGTGSNQSFDLAGKAELSNVSDDKYELTLVINTDEVATGTYVFNNDSAFNKVKVGIFNPAEGYALDTDINSGTLTITQITPGTLYTIIEGTFSVTATDPATGQAITVTNGSFKTAYDNN
ncbi:DUF6252 family protein [Flavobacterium subsaxonicum]|uniref:Lipoprotein n=1 Tax=Flavobacterium subsaxonicum WB 4.1-42 = DSM 21790 TaxID=1121898 RepID=A0A0A2MHE0_9FLAO|nr:DUF6252 family protein [Flavobacterium subsaxonicum]KGO90893.1 hypothetical protein Q766_20895 [Flavobacterium subsaxonicum WB 4.1-42 = DSM 21790]